MAFIPVINTVEVSLHFQSLGELPVNTLWFEKSSPWTQQQMLDLVNAIRNWFEDTYAQIVQEGTQLAGVKARDYTTADSFVVEAVVGLPVDGTRGGNPMPGNTSFAVKFTTGRAGRWRRGRNFLVGISSEDVSGNIISTVYSDAAIDAYTGLFAVAGTLGLEWVVVSRYFNKLPRAVGVTTPITGVSVTDNNVDSMRTRLAGRGD